MIIELNQAEAKLLSNILLNEVKNANTVNPKPYELGKDEYKILFQLINKSRTDEP